MKKAAAVIVALFILFQFNIPSYAAGLTLAYDGAFHEYNSDIYNIKVNGDLVATDMPGIILNDRTLVPVRAIFEKLGAEVKWDADNQKASVALNGISTELKINDNIAIVNNKQVSMDVPAKIINDRTMVPVRFIAEQLNLKVNWLPQEKLVTVDNTSLSGVTASETSESNDVIISVEGCRNYNIMRLNSPDRIVIDIPNVLAPQVQQRLDVNSGVLNAVRYAQFNAGTARIVLDVKGQPEYQIEQKEDSIVVHIKKPGESGQGEQPGNQDGQTGTAPATGAILYDNYGDNARIMINGMNAENSSNLQKDQIFSQIDDPSGKIHIISFNGDVLNMENSIIDINDNLLDTIQTTKVESNNKTYISFTSKEKLYYYIVYEPGMSAAAVLISKTELTDRGDARLPYIDSSSITHVQEGNKEKIIIKAPGYRSYDSSIISNPERIILDIVGAEAQQAEQRIDIGSSLISAIRFAKGDDSSVRIVLDANTLVQKKVTEENGQLVIEVSSAQLNNLIYKNGEDRVHFLLKNTTLTEGGKTMYYLYNASYDETATKFTITFPSYLGGLESGILQIDDERFYNVQIINDGQQTSIIFNAKQWFLYNIMTRYDDYGNLIDTAINILSPASKEDRLVVIDPGHGGLETGASYAGLLEKDLNLDIALRLNDLLKSRGVNTYMLRQNDEFVGLYERAYIANDLNALLFLSIHNNAFNSSATGTETLFYPSIGDGFNGRRFAEIIQNNLVSKLGTYNRGIVERPGLVVLKATTMTSSLAEVAFMDNDNDRALLMTDEFRQKAAEALAESISDALYEIK